MLCTAMKEATGDGLTPPVVTKLDGLKTHCEWYLQELIVVMAAWVVFWIAR